MDSKMGVDHQDAVELIANSKNVSKRAKIRFQGYHHVRPALMEKRLMGIISLDMKGLSHAMMDMFCANDRKDIGQLSNSFKYAYKSIEMNKEILGDHLIVANQYNNVGMLYCNSGKLDKAITNLQNCLEIQMQINGGSSYNVALCLNNIGYVFLRKGEYDEALKNLNKALEIYKLQKQRIEEAKKTVQKSE